MRIDPYYLKVMKDREDQAKAHQIVRDALRDPAVRLRGTFRIPEKWNDYDKNEREHAPEAFDIMKRVLNGEQVVPYPEVPTAEDAKTAKVMNLRETRPLIRTYWQPGDGPRKKVSAVDVANARTGRDISKRSASMSDIVSYLEEAFERSDRVIASLG